MDHCRERNARAAKPSTQAGKVSRRAMVAATMATATVTAVSHLAKPALAQAPDPDQDMLAFVLLSQALTGVNDPRTLAPELVKSDPGTDPINIKNDYFKWISLNDKTSSFAKLLGFAKGNPTPSPSDILASVEKGDQNVRFLARSIVLLWYLGSWYEPEELQKQATSPKPERSPSEVVSPKAYTQGLVWQIAGAHPMGYSNLQFGYWSRSPVDPNNSTPLITPKIP